MHTAALPSLSYVSSNLYSIYYTLKGLQGANTNSVSGLLILFLWQHFYLMHFKISKIGFSFPKTWFWLLSRQRGDLKSNSCSCCCSGYLAVKINHSILMRSLSCPTARKIKSCVLRIRRVISIPNKLPNSLNKLEKESYTVVHYSLVALFDDTNDINARILALIW